MLFENTQAATLEAVMFAQAENPMKAILEAASRRAERLSRADTLVDIAEFIAQASPVERRHIINMLIERGSEVDGCATELEDACCAIKIKGEE